MLPVLVATAAYLAAVGRWRVAGAWLLASGSALTLLGAMKSLSYACMDPTQPLPTTWWSIGSPSGHTASGALLCGLFAALCLRHRPHIAQWAAGAAALGAAAIGSALLISHIHTAAEVLVGAAVGMAAVLLFVAAAGPGLGRALPLRPLVALAGIVLVAHGARLPAERVIRDRVASLLRTAGGVCAATPSVTTREPARLAGTDDPLHYPDTGRSRHAG